MPSHLCTLLYILPIIVSIHVSGSNLALIWRSTGDTLFQDAGLSRNDPELSFNEPAPSSDETVSLSNPVTLGDDLTGVSADSSHLLDQVDPSGNPVLFPTESSESALWDTGSSIPMWGEEDEFTISSLPEEEAYDGSFEVADCSMLEHLPSSKKSRVRRLDDSKVCQPRPYPLTNPPTSIKPPPRTDSGRVNFGYRKYKNLLISSPELATFAEKLSEADDRNKICYVLSRGVLPFGYCPSSDPLERSVGSFIEISPLGFYFTWQLRQFRPGKWISNHLWISRSTDADTVAIFSERAALLVSWWFTRLRPLLFGH
jgi:hypothetical protein